MGFWGAIGGIFKSVDLDKLADKADDWKLTSEERMKYYLEWLSATAGEGFRLAQRWIGIAFTSVFLFMILTTFLVMVVSTVAPSMAYMADGVVELKAYIEDTMLNPMILILGVYFGGGFVNSITNGKKK